MSINVNTVNDALKMQEASHNDATVHKLLKENRSLAYIILQLVKDKEAYLQRILDLESIAPRKIKLPDGSFVVWSCPPSFIPEKILDRTTD